MVDEVDKTVEEMEIAEAAKLRSIQAAAKAIPTGHPGECLFCGEYFSRLVSGVCAQCRDKRGLP